MYSAVYERYSQHYAQHTTRIMQLLKTEGRVRIREFSRFDDNEQKSVYVMLNLSNTALYWCLSRKQSYRKISYYLAF